MAAVLTEIFIIIPNYYYVHRRLKTWPPITMFLKAVGIAAICGYSIHVSEVLPFVVQLLIVSVCYVSLVFLSGAISRKDIQNLLAPSD